MQASRPLKTGQARRLPAGVTPTIRNLESLTTSTFVMSAFKDFMERK
jgi:hypothetical protein